MNALKVINFWIHLFSGFSYIGGGIFFSLFLSPIAKNYINNSQFQLFLEDLHDRFQKISGLFITLLLLTGGFNIHFSRLARGEFSSIYFVALSFKILFFGILLTHYLLILKMILGKEQKTGLKSIPFQQTTFVLGLLILLMAAFLKYLP
ncbi:MAG: hypothetical protein HY036_08110 [Nitrospirae bacterium]|nr:hypothetical protein [Nitrospirota bacterium]MBI3352529.1 hypothetical protein [Nitrospirota bacterium]